jgi:hypothetical protein
VRIAVDRWTGQVEIEVPDAADVIAAEPRPEHPSLADPLAVVRDAIEHPYGMPPLAELVTPSSRIAIAFDDPVKFGPKFLVVPFLVDYLRGLGVPREQIVLVSAGGTHDRPRREHFIGLYRGTIPMFSEDFVGAFWPDRFLVHDAEDASQLVDMGASALGDAVEHNRILLDADLTIYSGSVLPLVWGGYSGTGVVVGLASPRSIYCHHRLAVIDHPDSHHCDPRSSLFQRRKDAVMDRIEEFTGKRVFYVEGVPSPLGGCAGFFAGQFRALRDAAWRCADEQHLRPARQYDAIVVGLAKHVFYGETRDPTISLLGATTVARAWRGQPVLRPGGAVVAVTACDGSVDRALHPSYAGALASFSQAGHARAVEARFDELRTQSDYLRAYREEHAYHPVHPVWLFNEIQYVRDHAGLVAFAECEPNDGARAAGVHCARSFREAWERVCDHCGPDPRTLVLPSYFSRVPMIFDVAVA